MENYLQSTPWDKRSFIIDTYEVTSSSEEALKQTNNIEGHFTLKVDPLENTENLKKYGFYYADTLTEPFCKAENFEPYEQQGIEMSRQYERDEILEIAEEAFKGGRFHRDFNIPNHMADKRYMNWVHDLIEKDLIIALIYEGKTAGFYAYENDKILLLAMSKNYRGKGLAKAFTSYCVREQFAMGHSELKTSISPSNVASLNVFISLGFRLRKSTDVYHKLNGSIPYGG